MMDHKIAVYRPTGPANQVTPTVVTGITAPWDQVRFALVDNGKPGARALLTGIADGLDIPQERLTVVSKQLASRPMNDAELQCIRDTSQAVVLAVGNCGSCASWTCHDAVTVASQLDLPAVLIITRPFEPLTRHVADSLGHPDLPVVQVEHGVGDLPFEVVHARGAKAAPQVREALLHPPVRGARPVTEMDEPGMVLIEPEQAVVDAWYIDNDFSDGLPIVAPTEARVISMLGRHIDDADQVIGRIATSYSAATLRAIAVNAVMAGCLPEYFDVVVAAVRGIADPAFNLHAVQATTHPVGPMILANGPVTEQIAMNVGTNALGPGCRANATIGRALRLVMQNIGRSIPGVTDRATFGQPGKYTFCLGENEAESPWEPFHVSRGFDRSASAVTVFAVEGPQNINDPGSVSAEQLLRTFTTSMCAPGSNHHQYPKTESLVLMSREHSSLLARHGHTRTSLQEHFFAHTRVPIGEFSTERVERWLAHCRPESFGPQNTTGVAAIADAPEDYLIVVAGGPGAHSMFVPGFGPSTAITVTLDAG
jgi:hypothetical protein